MKKIILIVFITFYSSLLYLQQVQVEMINKTTQQVQVLKQQQNLILEKNGYLKQKNLKKKIKKTKAKNAYKKAIKNLLEANSTKIQVILIL